MLRNSILILTLLMMGGCASVISFTTGDEGVQENLGRRSFGAMLDDSSIETAVKVNLAAADEQLKKAHINVISFNSTVLLVGQVQSQALKNMATRVANSHSRVDTVHNELEVAGATTFMSRSNDALISAKLKTLMLADPTASGLRTKVITENGVVYLMGLLTHEEADLTVELVRNAKGVTKVVRAFEYID